MVALPNTSDCILLPTMILFLPPVIKKKSSWLDATKDISPYICFLTVIWKLAKYFAPLKDFRFRIFSKEVKQPTQSGNIVFIRFQ